MNTTQQSAGSRAVGVFEGFVDGEPLVKWFDRRNMPQAGDKLWVQSATTAAPTDSKAQVSTWRKRIGVATDYPLHMPTDVERAMAAEIAELRALTQVQDEMKAAGDAQTCRSSEKVQAVTRASGACLAVESPQSGAAPAELTPQSEATNAWAALASANNALGLRLEAVKKAQKDEVLSVMLWLYRRLSRGYGRPPHIEAVIERLARETGTDVTGLLEERNSTLNNRQEAT